MLTVTVKSDNPAPGENEEFVGQILYWLLLLVFSGWRTWYAPHSMPERAAWKARALSTSCAEDMFSDVLKLTIKAASALNSNNRNIAMTMEPRCLAQETP